MEINRAKGSIIDYFLYHEHFQPPGFIYLFYTTEDNKDWMSLQDIIKDHYPMEIRWKFEMKTEM
jgi:hypothetical protein